MTPDIERIAREAGIEPYADHLHSYDANTAQISVVVKFAQLIAAECAKVCDKGANDWHGHDGKYACEDMASVIRHQFGA
jgi:hypothetical protein